MNLSNTRLTSKALYIVATTLLSTFANAVDWQWQISTGQLKQDYQENDNSSLTQDGVLNTETGAVPAIELSVINMLDPKIFVNEQWSPYGKLSLFYAKGKTDYKGYLQSGLSLTPYNTESDNEFIQAQYDLGLTYKATQSLNLTPLLSISHQRWERKLEQYTEDFDHTAILAGANINWQPSHQMPLTLQLQAKAGKIIDSHIDVPKLGLSQDIGNAGVTQIGLSGQYLLSDHISINTGISRQNFEYEQSDIQNGYQYPDSESKQTLWQLGLGYEF